VFSIFSMFHYRLIVKFDTYPNLERHRAVLPAIALLSFLSGNRHYVQKTGVQKTGVQKTGVEKTEAAATTGTGTRTRTGTRT